MSIGLGAIVEGAQASARNKRRFNLLLMEEREYYFQDYGGYLHVPEDPTQLTPFSARAKLKGRIHVCSKSLVFDPDDASHNITRLPFREIASIKPRSFEGTEYFVVHTRVAVELPANAPYIFNKYHLGLPASEFLISLSYVDMTTVLAFVDQLHGLYRLAPAEKPLALAALIRAREEAIQFESSAILDIRERVLLPNGQAILAQQVQPLLLCPGRLQLTDARLYFQNFNNVSSESTSRVEIAEIKRMYKRRFVMRDTALEIFTAASKASYGAASAATPSSLAQTSVYFNFASKRLRDLVYSLISSSDRFAPLAEQSLRHMTASWAAGQTSNFDYLLHLNQESGRSWMDLTQYPVMPWVLQDYTSARLDLSDPRVYRDLSKPIGALNPERLDMLQRRMREMPEEISHGHPYLYGSHYATPGYTLYYLARKAPQYMLRLQSGKFDAPDRLFHSIESTWTSVLNAPTDVKELIPEFYALDESSSQSSGSSASSGDFLLNTAELDLGVRQNGQHVEDVTLPAWAHSASDFVRQMRAALESDHVSAHLHLWIDLIFGSSQQGEAAVKANNLFYYLTYENAVDLDAVEPSQRASLELQMQEFGQCPRQIFKKPHPQRFQPYDEPEPEPTPSSSPVPLKPLDTDFSIPSSVEQPDWQRLQSSGGLPLSPSPLSPSEPIASAAFPQLQTSSYSPTATTLPLNQSLSSLANLAPLTPLAGAAQADLATLNHGALALQLAAEVANIQTRQLRVDENELKLTPTAIAPSSSSSSSSSTGRSMRQQPVQAWTDLSSDGWKRRDCLSLHRDIVTSVQLTRDGNLASVSADGHIKIYSIDGQRLIRSSKICDMALSDCSVSPDGKQVYISCWDNQVYLFNVNFGRVTSSVPAHDDAVSCLAVVGSRLCSGSWDTTVKLFDLTEADISQRPSMELTEHEAAITALALDASGNTAVSGSEDGGLICWDLRAKDGQSRQLEGFDGAVKSIAFSPFGSEFMVAGSDGTWRHIDSGTGKMLSQVSCSETLSAVRTDGFSLVGVGETGVVRGWSLHSPQDEIMSVPTGGPQLTLAINEDASLFCVANQKQLLFQSAPSS